MNIGIFGLGLMGGSLARGIKLNTDHFVIGQDVKNDTLARATLIGAIDKRMDDADYAKLDIAFICVDYHATMKILDEIALKLKDGAIVVDILGIKKDIIEILKEKSKAFPNLEFISVHPMTGREYSGIKYSTNDLFDGSNIILVPVKNTIKGMSALKRLFQALNIAKFTVTNPDEHDKYIAYTSQLAHVLSCAYIKNPLALTASGYTGGSFKDFSRVSRISSSMWPPLMVHNKEHLVNSIDDFIKHLNDLRSAILKEDEAELAKLLEEGNKLKNKIDKE